ncbi:MAG: hydrogenase maturation nickel metallochaperone HypA [Anaerolineales bacterium]|nr:hydrogenase maturation nickel metallochaperone HypA [Anaerolineales bacterium]MCA9931417.1 hydrogenase maturation nickel metallochaperone HypA [Anaerolineales bacterium]
MHELPVTESIFDIAKRYGQQANANRITDVYIVIGQLSSIVDDSVQFYWDIITRDTICDGAALHFERIPARLLCLDCNHTYTISQELTPCPQCESIRIKVIAGEEFRLDSIEIETEESTIPDH